MTMRALGPVSHSFTEGIPAALVRTTISIGFSGLAVFGSSFSSFTSSGRLSATGVLSLMALSVISANGVESRCEGVEEAMGLATRGVACSGSMFSLLSRVDGSGDSVALGVGNGGGKDGASGATGFLLFLFARTLCLPPLFLRGDDFLAGEDGSEGARLSGLRARDDAADSMDVIRRERVEARGVAGSAFGFRRF